MTRLPLLIRIALPLAFAMGLAAPSWALPLAGPSVDGASRSVEPLLIAVDCADAAARAARQTGGRVLAARPNSAQSCEVTVLVPNEGGRPRRVVITVPA